LLRRLAVHIALYCYRQNREERRIYRWRWIGADEVIAMRDDANEVMGGRTEVVAYATAVVVGRVRPGAYHPVRLKPIFPVVRSTMALTQGMETKGVPAAAMASSGAETPDWVTQELPEQYAEIARQIAGLKEQSRAYEGIAAVLWQTGSALTSAVADLFMSLGFETELAEYGSTCDLRVNLSDGRRLLIDVVSERQGLDRKSPHIARLLKVLQDEGGEKDRVVLAANIGFDQALSDRRGEPVSVEAMRLIQGLGANFVPTSALFGIWKASLSDALQARNSVMRLHSMDGGIFR